MPKPTDSLLLMHWRLGRNNKNLIYAQQGAEPSRSDPLIAVATGSPIVAEVFAHTIVTEHNREIERQAGM
jgi:hypothetical protein